MSRSHHHSKRWWLNWIGWGLASACLAIFLFTFDVRLALVQIARAKPVWIAVAVGANFLLMPLLTEQWSRLLPPTRRIPWSVLWECVTLSIAAMNTLPFGTGHAVAVGVVAKKGGAGLQGAVSLLALEQLCEGVAKLALLGAALAVAPLPDPLRRATWILAGFLAAAAGLLLWLAYRPHHGSSPRFARLVRNLVILKQPGPFALAVALSLVMKVGELAAIVAAQQSLGIDLPLSTAPVVLAVVTFASLVSVTPGNLGIYEAAAVGIYKILGVPPEDALALGLVQHSCFLLPIVGTGYVMTVWRSIGPRSPDVARSSSR
ncbi:MAG: lysylphosphatidylglycerol synthase transmembrane domain-containing protein [Opitutus sp.]